MLSIAQVLKSSFIMLLVAALLLFSTVEIHALIDIEEGDVPKQFALEDMDGNVVSLSDMDGNPVVIVFWKLMEDKSFLDYSKDELLFLNNYYKRMHLSDRLEVIAVYVPKNIYATAGEVEMVRQFADKHEIAFPLVIDEGMKLYVEYGIIALPSTFMVGVEGEIEYISTSFPLSAGPLFSKKIKELIRSDASIHQIAARSKESGVMDATPYKCMKRLC